MSSIDSVLQEGLLVDRKWLTRHNINRPAVDYYVRSGALTAVSRGIYRKPGPPLKWQNIVYSLNQLGYSAHVGQMSALQFHGYQHYLNLSGGELINLYSYKKLPGWISDVYHSGEFYQVVRNPFPEGCSVGIEDTVFGTWDWLIPYSTAERGFVELLSTVKSASDIRHVDTLFEGAASLRPLVVQKLLENCLQVKAKRLFFWLAKKHNHTWYNSLDQGRINLGSGKRQIVKNGILNKDFLITVPVEMKSEQTEPIF